MLCMSGPLTSRFKRNDSTPLINSTGIGVIYGTSCNIYPCLPRCPLSCRYLNQKLYLHFLPVTFPGSPICDNPNNVRWGVLIVNILKIFFSWNVTQCILYIVACRGLLRPSWRWSKRIYPEDGDNILLRNLITCIATYTVLYLGGGKLSSLLR